MNQKASYTGLLNISSTVCISRTIQSRSELSADLTGVNVEVGLILFCLFREAIYLRACTTLVFIAWRKNWSMRWKKSIDFEETSLTGY